MCFGALVHVQMFGAAGFQNIFIKKKKENHSEKDLELQKESDGGGTLEMPNRAPRTQQQNPNPGHGKKGRICRQEGNSGRGSA